jgi:uncharacterized protein (DUF924 family)
MMVQPSDVLSFWKEAGQEKWFTKNADLDAEFKAKFYDAHFAAARGDYASWMDEAESALALILLLDQFPRNCFRGTGHMFATDGLCLALANRAIEKDYPAQVADNLKAFFYLPLMHSEGLGDQKRCVELCKPLGENTHHHAVVHLEIIEKFGRFPHRNKQLGRITTAEEQAFLDAGGFAG